VTPAEFAASVDRTEGRLDAAVLAYRAEPTDANRAALMAAQREHSDAFIAEQTVDYQRRTGNVAGHDYDG
jgi:hypothetical protein